MTNSTSITFRDERDENGAFVASFEGYYHAAGWPRDTAVRRLARFMKENHMDAYMRAAVPGGAFDTFWAEPLPADKYPPLDNPYAHLKAATGVMVITSLLREGDLIRNHGCIMRINEVKSRVYARDEEGDQIVYWSKATILLRYSGTIPLSWIDYDAEGNSTGWLVQGNDYATWCVVGRAEDFAPEGGE